MVDIVFRKNLLILGMPLLLKQYRPVKRNERGNLIYIYIYDGKKYNIYIKISDCYKMSTQGVCATLKSKR